MDGSAEELTTDSRGICNFCCQADQSLKEIEREKHKLPNIISEIKRNQFGKDYDVLIGLSGGADSSTALHHAVRLGLRPLCFSIDNGWNDPKADENIMKLVEGLKVPFIRQTIDVPLFRKLQAAFFQAGVPNIEIPTDHILMAASLDMAHRYGIKWIISGGNVATESIMPPSWGYNARDLRHIKAIYKWATRKRLGGLPLCGLVKWNYYRWVVGIKTLYLLDYLDYNRQDSIQLLERDYGWKPYGNKHEESVFTSWFQNFYLFEKFGYDKRKAHYSSLIISGQMTKREALDLLAERPVYPQLGIEDRVMGYTKRSHYDFPTDEKLYMAISKIVKKIHEIIRRLSD